jgi:archaeosine synthase
MLTKKRGVISLTLEGAQRLFPAHVYWVEIEDFMPHGSIFATGVCDADMSIRIGDEVIVIHHGEIRAVGVACMTAQEMIQSNRGEAVKVRHYKRYKN